MLRVGSLRRDGAAAHRFGAWDAGVSAMGLALTFEKRLRVKRTSGQISVSGLHVCLTG